MKFYTVPVDDQSRQAATLIAESIEGLLVLINEDRLDTENNYIFTVEMLATLPE